MLAAFLWCAPAAPGAIPPASEPKPEQAADDEPRAAEDGAEAEDSADASTASATDEDREIRRGTSEESQPSASASAPATAPADDEGPALQFEAYLPSVLRLAEAARRSRTAALYQAVSGMVSFDASDADEGLDVAALLELLEHVRSWPDTAAEILILDLDGDGRPRWAVNLDWPLTELRARVAELSASEGADKVLGEVRLTEREDDLFEVGLPDTVLAYLAGRDGGSQIRSTIEWTTDCGSFAPKDADGGGDDPADDEKAPLLQCRYVLPANGGGVFGAMTGIRDVYYNVRLDKVGRWREFWQLRWNVLVGAGVKATLKRVRRPFDCPADAFISASFSLAGGSGMADQIAELPEGTLAGRAGADVNLSVVPGTGFLPAPDLFYQMKVHGIKRAVEAIREAIVEDNRERKEDDRPIAWREESVDGKPLFWLDPGADTGYGIQPITFRTVVFFDTRGSNDSDDGRLIIVKTSTWADGARRRWKALTADADGVRKVPSSRRAHWQMILDWKNIYALAQPWLCLLSSFMQGAELPPTAAELGAALSPSRVDLRIEFAGLKVAHRGPIPLGAAYVPLVAYAALQQGAGHGSEAGREQTACRNLRVLHHHARLFEKDYRRWPANVAELDGYVDFDSHSYLLRLRAKRDGLLSGLSRAIFGTPRGATSEDDEAVDDSLYEIDWSQREADWKLKFRDGEFKHWATIYVDAEGEIHRVAKAAEDDADSSAGAAESDELETAAAG
ncbi:MAG: hypothetical protein V3T70_03185 [Phycisphaerae bacterium]